MTLTVRREHAGGAVPTTLASDVTSGSTTLSIVDGTGWPTGSVGDFVVTLERGTDTEERVLCESRTGAVLTVAAGGRGWDGTVARAHQTGAVAEHTWSTTEADEASAHSSSVAGHGVDTVAGLTEVQTFTNKTLTSPVINTPAVSGGTLTGSVNATGATISGGPTISGNPNFSGNPTFPGSPNFSGTPAITNFTNAGHNHSGATTGGNIPQTSVTNLVADLAAKLDDSQRGAANGVASLDASTLIPTAQLPSIPYANLPVGTGASQVSQGTHTHTVDAGTEDGLLTVRVLNDNDPALVLSSLSLAAGTWLLIGQCRGGTCATATSARWQYFIQTSVGTLLGGDKIVVRHDQQSVGGGGTVLGMLTNASTATVEFMVEKVGTGAVVTTEDIGFFLAIPLFGI